MLPKTALGQSRLFGDVGSMSELPSNAAVERTLAMAQKCQKATVRSGITVHHSKAVATKRIIFLVQNLKRVGRDFTSPVPETLAMVDGRMVDRHADGRG